MNSTLDINELLNYALESGASDLHLSVGSKPMVRIDGSIKPLNLDKLTRDSMISILPQVMNAEQLKKFEQDMEIDFSTICEYPPLRNIQPQLIILLYLSRSGHEF